MVYSEKHERVEAARSRERQIKRWKRSKKEALISGSSGKLKKLSKRKI
jgi:predicted GIY-YIG superfamily endonuclease